MTARDETPEEKAARKAAELARLLADGWREDELSWHEMRPPSPEKLTEFLARYQNAKGVPMSEERRERIEAQTERLRRGQWLITQEGMERRVRERCAAEGVCLECGGKDDHHVRCLLGPKSPEGR